MSGPSLTAQFTYNGNRQRVKSVIGNETTYFAGGHFELKVTTNPNANEVSKYYFAGASRVAVRKYIVPQPTSLTYLLGDHLGSTSLAVDASTGDVIETRYEPCPYRVLREGQVRYHWVDSNLSTTPAYKLPVHTFTGQRSYMDDPSTSGMEGFGLMDYNARMYDPVTGRFTSADSIVPGGVQGLDRYAYVNNSPVNYVDPSGHEIQGRCNYLKNYNCKAPPPDSGEYLQCGGNLDCKQENARLLGISVWEYDILAKLYNQGGADAVHGVNYILANGIRIKVGEKYWIEKNQYGGWIAQGDWQSDFEVDAWYDSKTIYLNPNSGYEEGVMPSNFGLAGIIHEAKHIEQGVFRAFTKEGEMEAGQIGIGVYASLEGTTPDKLPQKWMRDAHAAKDVWEYQDAYCNNNHSYCLNISILPPYFQPGIYDRTNIY